MVIIVDNKYKQYKYGIFNRHYYRSRDCSCFISHAVCFGSEISCGYYGMIQS